MAINRLRKLPFTHLIKIAKFYSNKAWGRKVQPRFFNTVAAIYTSLTPEQLLRECRRIENKQGRYRHVKWGARTIDLDILYYGSKVINKPDLIIPHPRIHERDFVLIPLKEIQKPKF